MTTEDRKLSSDVIRDYVIGGAMLGIPAAVLAAAVRNYRRSKAEEARATGIEEGPADDHILKINLPSGLSDKKSAGLWDEPEALVGGVAAGALTYAGTTAILRYLEKKKLQRELDEAQIISLGGKIAGHLDGFSGVWGTLGAAPVFAALASGVVAYHALNSYFPREKSEREDQLSAKKIRLIVDGNNLGDVKKAARCPDAVEGMLRIASATDDKYPCGLNDVIKCAAHGFCDDLLEAHDRDHLFEFSGKLASELEEPSPARKSAAIMWLANDGRVAPFFSKVAAGHLLETFPTYDKCSKAAMNEGESLNMAAVMIMTAAKERSGTGIGELISDDLIGKYAAEGHLDLAGLLKEALESKPRVSVDEGGQEENDESLARAGAKKDDPNKTKNKLPEKAFLEAAAKGLAPNRDAQAPDK
jgi:hypothetical protein